MNTEEITLDFIAEEDTDIEDIDTVIDTDNEGDNEGELDNEFGGNGDEWELTDEEIRENEKYMLDMFRESQAMLEEEDFEQDANYWYSEHLDKGNAFPRPNTKTEEKYELFLRYGVRVR